MTAEFKWYKYKFGEAGNLAAIPDDVQGGGDLSLEEGWGSDYELDPDTQVNAKFMSRPQHNQLWQTATGNINFWQKNLYPLHTLAAANGGVAVVYDFATRVRYDAGAGEKVYEVIDVAGTDELPSVTADWVLVNTAYPRSGTAGGEQRTNAQNEALFQEDGVGGTQVRTNDQLDARYDDRYKAFALTGDIVQSLDPGIIARGFLEANGQEADRLGTADLYSIIGTIYGAGNGTSTYNLPAIEELGTVIYQEVTGYPGTEPTGIAVDSSNSDVWICDDGTNRVYKLAGGVTPYVLFGSVGTNPTDIAVNSSNGDVWVCDSGLDQILLSAGGSGSYVVVGSYPSILPLGIAVDSSNGDVWICDAASNEIYRLTGGSGSYNVVGSYPATNPRGIAVNPSNGDVWVCDSDTDSIYKLTGGSGSYAVVGSYPGTLPNDISVNPITGDVWISDSAGDVIYKLTGGEGAYNAVGNYPSTIPAGVAVNPSDGNAWVIELSNDTVYKTGGRIPSYIKT